MSESAVKLWKICMPSLQPGKHLFRRGEEKAWACVFFCKAPQVSPLHDSGWKHWFKQEKKQSKQTKTPVTCKLLYAISNFHKLLRMLWKFLLNIIRP